MATQQRTSQLAFIRVGQFILLLAALAIIGASAGYLLSFTPI